MKSAIVIIAAIAALGCGDSTGPAVAVTLNLHSVDGVTVPVKLITPGGKLVTLREESFRARTGAMRVESC
jgi:hypothetical protein